MRVFFIRFMQVMFFISLSTSSVHAEFAELDQLFLEEGIVDRNYKYIDKKLAAKAFTEINNELADSLPIMIDANTEVTSVFHSPSIAVYSYTLDLQNQIDDIHFNEFKKFLHQEFTTAEKTRSFCSELFDAKFQQANGYTFLLYFYDESGRKFVDITLNEKICPPIN